MLNVTVYVKVVKLAVKAVQEGFAHRMFAMSSSVDGFDTLCVFVCMSSVDSVMVLVT